MPRRHRTQAARDECLADVAAKFNNGNGESLDDLAHEYRTKRAVVRQWLIEAGVRTTDGACIGLVGDELALAIAGQWDAGATIRMITATTGFTEAQVTELLRSVDRDTSITRERRLLPEDEVVDRFRAGEPILVLVRRYGCSHQLIARVLDDHGVVRPGLVARRQRENDAGAGGEAAAT